MKIEIRVGKVSVTSKRIKYPKVKRDNIHLEKQDMYKFLADCKDCIIEDAEDFLVYALNNCICSFLVDESCLNESDKKDLAHIPKLSPKTYKIIQILEDGVEVSMQNQEGRIVNNYFNELMGVVMDDFYLTLNHYN